MPAFAPGPTRLALIVVGVALNLGLGFLVAALRLPFYLDSIGTVLTTFVGGLWCGIPVGIASVLLGSIYTPTTWAYAPTAIAIACFVRAVLPLGYLRKLASTIVLGLCLGVVSAVVSAPITVYVFGGMSAAGTDYFTAMFQAVGQTIYSSVLLGGLSSDPLDKLFTSLVAYAIVLRLPKQWRGE
jgi:energy-coupling factor transport system substrate-specific component